MSALAIAGLVVIGLGVLLVLIGTWQAIARQARKREEDKGINETLEGLAKLAEALKNYPLGMQLVFLGVLLIIIGGGLSGVSTLA